MALAQMKRRESSASAAEDMTFLMIWAIVRTGPLIDGTFFFFGKHDVGACAAARLGNIEICGVGVS